MSARVDALLASNRPSSTTNDQRPTPNAINTALMAAERALLSPDGIPGRPWYRHLIYAPKPTYAPEPLPGVSEALESRDRQRITDQVARLAAALDRAAGMLTR